MSGPARRFGPVDAAEVVALPRQVDAAAVQTLERQADVARSCDRRRLVVDLRSTTLIDTPTLGELCVALRRILSTGMSIAVVGADLRVQEVLELCDIDGLALRRSVRAARRRRALPFADPARLDWRGLLTREH